MTKPVDTKSGFGHILKIEKRITLGLYVPLNDGGTTYTEAKQKAQILNKQFESVFTNEDVTNVPQLDSSAYPEIGDVLFTTHGIQLQLERLDPAKAPGPDQLPTRVLKLCAEQISPGLQIIYSVIRMWYSSTGLVICQHHPCFQKRQPKYSWKLSTNLAYIYTMQSNGTYHLSPHYESF